MAAVAGDTVVVADTGIRVNGIRLRNSTPLKQDSLGRPMSPVPPGVHHVQKGEVWLVSGHNPKSLDSRYFGAISDQQIVSIASPVLTEGP